MYDLDTQSELLLCPLLASALVTCVYPQVRETCKAPADLLAAVVAPLFATDPARLARLEID